MLFWLGKVLSFGSVIINREQDVANTQSLKLGNLSILVYLYLSRILCSSISDKISAYQRRFDPSGFLLSIHAAPLRSYPPLRSHL